MTRFALFYQSVISDWNHGNAHFLRGLMRALQARGHSVVCYEQVDNWSLTNLLQSNPRAIEDFSSAFPDLHYERYSLSGFDRWVDDRLAEADIAIVHEWNDPSVIKHIGESGVRAFFHDTHYRVVLDEAYRSSLGLENFEGILAYSPSVAERYCALGFRKVFVLHEAADTTVFKPEPVEKNTDVVFVGNYGDGDRSDELEDFVIGLLALQYPRPHRLQLSAGGPPCTASTICRTPSRDTHHSRLRGAGGRCLSDLPAMARHGSAVRGRA